MNKIKISKIMIITTACLLMLTGQAVAALEWTLDQSIPLTTGARDVAESPDGKRLYVLTGEGTILVLDPDGRVEMSIPGPFNANRLKVNRDGSKLFLAGEKQKSLQVISLSERVEIDLTGSPFKGDEAAAVAVVVFSDFQ
jgi:DNA-binding beta-propeller fold protein YncE